MDNRQARAQELYDTILLPYQKDGVDFMTRTGGCALQGDDMGLGKTLQTLVTLEKLPGHGPVLIVAPKFALAVWQGEIQEWLHLNSTVYTGTPKKRSAIWNEWLKNPTPFLITNYAMLSEIGSNSRIKHPDAKEPHPGTETRAVHWKALVIDEAHMSGISNYKNKFYKVCLAMSKMFPYKYLLSGTFVRQGCIDLFGPLSIVNPLKFRAYWSFVHRYCVVLEGPFGKTIERNPANIEAFRRMLHEYYIGRKKTEVLKDLPGKRRQKLPVVMSKGQQRIYEELEQDLMSFIPDTGEIVITPSTLALILRLRQLLVSPELLGANYPSPAIETIIEHSHLRLDEGVPVCVFTSFRSVIPILEREFKAEYPGITVYKIQGGLTPEEFGNAWQSFQKTTGPRVLLVVIKSGASFQATAADTAYFIGPEWDATLNVQAEDRLNRIGQKNFVNIFYVDYGTPVESRVWELLNEKTETSTFITGTPEEFLQALRRRSGRK